MNTPECVILCLFSPYLMFFMIDNQRGILFYQSRQLPCRARGARAYNLCSHLPFRVDSFVHVPLIDRLVCTIQANQILVALIIYAA